MAGMAVTTGTALSELSVLLADITDIFTRDGEDKLFPTIESNLLTRKLGYGISYGNYYGNFGKLSLHWNFT